MFIILLALCATSFAIKERDITADRVRRLILRSAGNSPQCNTSPGISEGSSTAEEFVQVHNEYRHKTHSANMIELTWDSELAKVTQELVDRCEWGHDLTEDCSGNGAGQNLYVSWTSGGSIKVDPSKAVKSWYEEIHDYEYSTGSCSKVCGHYTQVVWAESERMGCAAKECSSVKGLNWGNGKYMLVACNYTPPGNWVGEKPYEKGADCSNCPSGYSCHDGLCASKKR